VAVVLRYCFDELITTHGDHAGWQLPLVLEKRFFLGVSNGGKALLGNASFVSHRVLCLLRAWPTHFHLILGLKTLYGPKRIRGKLLRQENAVFSLLLAFLVQKYIFVQSCALLLGHMTDDGRQVFSRRDCGAQLVAAPAGRQISRKVVRVANCVCDSGKILCSPGACRWVLLGFPLGVVNNNDACPVGLREGVVGAEVVILSRQVVLAVVRGLMEFELPRVEQAALDQAGFK
jgi:hypothetical protein